MKAVADFWALRLSLTRFNEIDTQLIFEEIEFRIQYERGFLSREPKEKDAFKGEYASIELLCASVEKRVAAT